jgi:hypothetical protein
MSTTRAVPWSSRQPGRTSTIRSPSTTTSPGAGSVPLASNTAPPVNTVRSIVTLHVAGRLLSLCERGFQISGLL